MIYIKWNKTVDANNLNTNHQQNPKILRREGEMCDLHTHCRDLCIDYVMYEKFMYWHPHTSSRISTQHNLIFSTVTINLSYTHYWYRILLCFRVFCLCLSTCVVKDRGLRFWFLCYFPPTFDMKAIIMWTFYLWIFDSCDSVPQNVHIKATTGDEAYTPKPIILHRDNVRPLVSIVLLLRLLLLLLLLHANPPVLLP